MTASPVLVSPTWLALREEAPAQARSLDLVEEVQRWLPPGGSAVIQDLGSGTGSMGRWLAPLLTGPQHWVTAEAADGRLSVTVHHWTCWPCHDERRCVDPRAAR